MIAYLSTGYNQGIVMPLEKAAHIMHMLASGTPVKELTGYGSDKKLESDSTVSLPSIEILHDHCWQPSATPEQPTVEESQPA